jgi:3D (Asp-Asp-Asp) domain-containing protein
MLKLITVLTTILVTLNTSAYTLTGNPMANGEYPYIGSCAVDKINGQWIPFGTVITLPDGKKLTVTDRFGDGRNNALDIFMQSENECWQFGRKNLVCRVELP